MIPEESPRWNDLVDVVTRSSTKTIQIEQKDGSITTEQVLDEETLWWKTLDVSNEKFSRMAFELKEWERLGDLAYSNMPKERADQFYKDVMGIGQSYRRAIDAKSSESRVDKHNSKKTLLDKMGKTTTEKIYTSKGTEVKRTLGDVMLGRNKERDMDNE